MKEDLIKKLQEFVENNDCSTKVFRHVTKTILDSKDDTLIYDWLLVLVYQANQSETGMSDIFNDEILQLLLTLQL